MYKREQTLSYARALRSIYLFSLLLEGSQFHAYLTAQAQNALPRTFGFLTYQTYQYPNALTTSYTNTSEIPGELSRENMIS